MYPCTVYTAFILVFKEGTLAPQMHSDNAVDLNYTLRPRFYTSTLFLHA